MPKLDSDKARLLEWASSRIQGAYFGELAYPIAVIRQGKIAAVVVAHDFRMPNVIFSFAADTPRWASKQTLQFMAHYAFKMLKARRITALVDKKNKRSRRFQEGVGFKLEGVLRKAAENGDDVCVYGMMESDFRFIDSNEQTQST